MIVWLKFFFVEQKKCKFFPIKFSNKQKNYEFKFAAVLLIVEFLPKLLMTMFLCVFLPMKIPKRKNQINFFLFSILFLHNKKASCSFIFKCNDKYSEYYFQGIKDNVLCFRNCLGMQLVSVEEFCV